MIPDEMEKIRTDNWWSKCLGGFNTNLVLRGNSEIEGLNWWLEMAGSNACMSLMGTI